MRINEGHKTTLGIAYPIIEEERRVDLHPQDIALIVLIQREIEHNPDGLLAIPYSSIQALSSRIDLMESRDEQKAERRLSERLSRLLNADCLVQADLLRLHLSSDPEYQLTSLGETFAEWHMEQSRFSGEPLSAIFKVFINQLSIIVEESEKAETPEDWKIEIIPQMQHALRDILISVQKHQQELDRRHAELCEFIPDLLTEHSEEAIKQCKEKLSNVLQTINDLQETVLGSSSTTTALISRIYELATPFDLPHFENVHDDLTRRLTSINNWITQRLADWTDHHGVVHNILRTIIRVDRHKRITDALKRSVAVTPSWSVLVLEEQPFIRMRRNVETRRKVRSAPRISREIHEQQTIFEEIQPDELPELLRHYAQKDYEAFSEIRVSQVLKRALPTIHPDELRVIAHFPEFISWVVSIGSVEDDKRTWEVVSEEISIEELKVTADDLSY